MSNMEVEDLDASEENSPEISPVVSSDEDDDDGEERIAQLQKEVDASPYTYELHIRLINLCKELDEVNSLHKAREKMSELFPLTPELWLDWIDQEGDIFLISEEHMTSLYERAVKDYTSVNVWNDYLKFAFGIVVHSGFSDAALANCRDIFERAATCVGVHVELGGVVWRKYRAFEKNYLAYLKTEHGTYEEIREQEERIFRTYTRELSIPLIGMSETHMDFQNEEFDVYAPDKSVVKYAYFSALRKLEELLPFEEALKSSDPPHYEEWKRYIHFRIEDGDPASVLNLFERAVLDNCLKEELWIDYGKYLEQVVKIKEVSIPVYERAVRNCPWCAQLWVFYARTLERFEEDHTKIIEVFETALGMGFTKAEDFKELWLAYVGYLRRKVDKEQDLRFLPRKTDISSLETIAEVFDRAITQMNHYFWGSDSEYIVMKSWISLLIRYTDDFEKCDKLWKELISHGHKEEARVWLDYANFMKLNGHSDQYKETLFEALSCVSDWHETFIDLLVTLESEEGSLKDLERTLEICNKRMQTINDKRIKKLEEESNSVERVDRRRGSFKRQTKFPRNDNIESKPPIKMDSEGFKIPPPPPHRGQSPTNSKPPEALNDPEVEKKKRKSEDEERKEPEAKKRKVSDEKSHGESVKHDSSKDDRTVFLSNLSFKIEEDKIKEFFCEMGEIEEVRLVKDYKGRSKGFCYVVYKSQEHAKAALSKDRALLEGRPVLISPCEDKKNNPSTSNKLKFSSGLERNKLFVKNLPSSTTKEDLETMFKEYGALKDVRVVTYRNGHSKGMAYIEYQNETSASNAVVKMDGTQVMENVISVAISNPPPRKPKKEFSSMAITDSLGGGRRNRTTGPRGRGRTQLTLLPRSVARSPSGKSAPVSNGNFQQNGKNSAPQEGTKPLTNSDFAKMLQK